MMSIVQKRSTRKRAATRRYINESENYQAPRSSNIAQVRKTEIVEEMEEQANESIDEATEEIEEAEDSDEVTNLHPQRRRSCRYAEKFKNDGGDEKKKDNLAVIPDFVKDIDTEVDKTNEGFSRTSGKHQTQKNVDAFLRACDHLNVKTALLFLEDNDLKTSIELGKQVQLPNQVPAWLDDMLLSDPTCLRRNGEMRPSVLAEKLKNVVSLGVFMESALKAKGHRPIDHVQLLVDVAPKPYTQESGDSDKKRYTEPTCKSGGVRSSTSHCAHRDKQEEKNASRRSGRKSGAQQDSGNGRNPNSEKADTSFSYSLRPKAATEEVFNDSNVPIYKYETYTHLANHGAGSSTSAYRPIVDGSTIKFSMDGENDGSQPSTSEPVCRTSRSSRPSHRSRNTEPTQDDDDNDDEEDYGKTVRARPNCSQGKKK